MAFEHILVVGGGWKKKGEARAEGRRDGGAACSFKPSFEDDAYAALMCLRLYTRATPLCLFICSQCMCSVCVPILFVCLCLLVVVCMGVY